MGQPLVNRSRPATSELDALFFRTLDAYREGRAKPSLADSASGVGFDYQLEAEISLRLRLDEQLLMRVSSAARSRALMEARRDHLNAARQALDESRKILVSASLSEEAKLIVTSFHQAVEAYLEYKAGRYDGATRCVYAALDHDGTLITRYGYTILELHRIQLAHNLMRIRLRDGQSKSAVGLCVDLLSYIEGDEASWPLPEFSNGASPAELPPEMLEAMFVQLLGELALFLAGRPNSEAAEIFAPLACMTVAPIAACRHARARRWVRAKGAFIDGRVEAFLEEVAPLLCDGPAGIPLLWSAVAADLRDLCRGFESEGARLVAREIGADAPMWSQLPRQLKSQLRAIQ